MDVVPAITELQSRLNDEYFGSFRLTTTNTAVFTTAWTSDDLPTDGAWRITVEVQARATDGSTAYYWLMCVFKRVASSVATQVSSTAAVAPAIEDVSSWDVQFAASTNGVVVQVKGDLTRVVNWVVVPYVKELV